MQRAAVAAAPWVIQESEWVVVSDAIDSYTGQNV